MSNEEPKPKPEKSEVSATTIPWISPPDGICEVYSNFLHLNWTLYDVRIRFAQIIANPEQPPDTAQWVISEEAAVTMPWGQAKLFRNMLSEAVKRYEDLNGEITIPTLPV